MRKKEDNQNIKSFIAEGVEIQGKMHSNGSLRIDGTVDGEIDVKGELFVGNTGKIKGEVKVDNVTMAGKLEGNLAATGKIEITSTGQVFGDIRCSVITIDEGGILEGTSSMAKAKQETLTLATDKKARK
ncbi:MAG: polymer-forming cytoskeletal protein [Bacillota bacterium]|nr:polymer-forming cytoskeletal protein [Bacillota bacterium]